ncbi:hypothetical protein [Pandoraea apista]|uniref:Uncharacterized protein n=1 Tax=Pandoraea apista TaxID=93218 RepID=A0A5E5P751_9BURK|nr:hypothetical protein [Pandoraea apista]OXS92731.1 hypothetical protein B7H01_17530 [Pandoraea apista]VVG72053.1 hypothetical protein PAP18089_03044 [Pandoraea apista]
MFLVERRDRQRDVRAGYSYFVTKAFSITPQDSFTRNRSRLTLYGNRRCVYGMTTVGPDCACATFSTMTQNVSGGACAGGNCMFSTRDVLTGAAANNAGIVYSLTGPDARVTGTAGFKC